MKLPRASMRKGRRGKTLSLVEEACDGDINAISAQLCSLHALSGFDLGTHLLSASSYTPVGLCAACSFSA